MIIQDFLAGLSEVSVEFVGKFREVCGSRNMNFTVKPGTRLLDFLRELGVRIGVDLVPHFIDSEGRPMEEYSMILLNGRVVDMRRLEEYTVNPGDKIVLSPSVAGGG
jgi:molybdopterin converting factor small subunit